MDCRSEKTFSFLVFLLKGIGFRKTSRFFLPFYLTLNRCGKEELSGFNLINILCTKNFGDIHF